MFLFERGDDAPDLVVHRRCAGRIGSAARIFDVLVPVEIALRRLIGRVHRVEGEIEKQRLFRIVLLDEFDGLVAEQGGGIALLLHHLVVAIPIDLVADLVREIVDLADQRSVL